MGVEIASNIIFLGTGGDSYVVGKQLRASGGVILQIGDDQYHIDPGPGALNMAKETGINLRANLALFVTHNHINHANDVNAVIDAMTYKGFDKKGVLVANNTVVNGSAHYEPFLHKYYRDCLERFIVLGEGKKVGINDVEIRAIKAKHSEPSAIGFKFITPDYTLTYTGDTAYSVETLSEYENSNVMILNVPCLKKEEARNNLCKEDAIKIINKIRPRLAIITHFGINFLKADPLYQAREIQKETNTQVVAAKDGMVINPISYDIQQGQKTLYKYAKKEGIRLQEFKQQEEKVKEINKMIEENQTELGNDVSENNPEELEKQ
ncbi:MBL fold metallo-hydrolase [Candidatus Woesearchaeota archaeon]|nr:MBL fold metallo-hydrolase [Candidatus Woesearchaeota archaeon]